MQIWNCKTTRRKQEVPWHWPGQSFALDLESREQTQAIRSKKVSAQQRKQRQRHNLKSGKIFAKYTSEKGFQFKQLSSKNRNNSMKTEQRSRWAHPAPSQALGKLTHRQPKVAKRTWGCWWRWAGDKRRQGVGATRKHCVCVGSYQRTNLINNK